ncbi:delta-aminolevulinic acid dehydratase [Bacillus sp. HU-1818]|uniref:delta-aminolevulinic acid dehydratase n=1 Tax=Bacillus sp. HU-1818 TaxID=2704469 RepID=UPI001F5C59EB|nr:delta-aminolevulinic acid dehydratase [Bacillus sp. HU-1818]MCI3194181.1 delta-aminolevulinic acid dehydratase [Bacillus sp. HU-1818]
MSKPELFISLVTGPNCDMDSFALRSTLEYFGARVTMHWIGRPNDLVDVLTGEDLEKKVDYLILNFHGDEGKFCMPELGEEVYEDNEPRGEFFDDHDVIRYTNLNNLKVIASGCTLGTESLAKAFLKCGCHSYIAPNDYIDGNPNLMFLIKFMYEIINNKRSQKEAFEIAKSIDQETSKYNFFYNKHSSK